MKFGTISRYASIDAVGLLIILSRYEDMQNIARPIG